MGWCSLGGYMDWWGAARFTWLCVRLHMVRVRLHMVCARLHMVRVNLHLVFGQRQAVTRCPSGSTVWPSDLLDIPGGSESGEARRDGALAHAEVCR